MFERKIYKDPIRYPKVIIPLEQEFQQNFDITIQEMLRVLKIKMFKMLKQYDR